MIKISHGEIDQVAGGRGGTSCNTIETKTLKCPFCNRYTTHIRVGSDWVCKNCHRVNPQIKG